MTALTCIHLGCNRLFQGHHHKCADVNKPDPDYVPCLLGAPVNQMMRGPDPIIVEKDK